MYGQSVQLISILYVINGVLQGLLCRDPPADIDGSVLHRFFDDKVAGVRAATAAPQFTAAQPTSATSTSQIDVIQLLHAATATVYVWRACLFTRWTVSMELSAGQHSH